MGYLEVSGVGYRLPDGRPLLQPNPLGVRTLDAAPDGSLVLAGDRGLERHGPNGVERIDLPAPIRAAGNTVRIKAVTAGNHDIWLWVGHFGLWHYRDGRWTGSAEPQPRQSVVVAVDAARRSYFGHRDDALRIDDGGHVREYGPAQGVDVGNFQLIVPGEALLIAGGKGHAGASQRAVPAPALRR